MRFVPLALSVLLMPIVTVAHGDRPSLEAEVGAYLIDIGYDDLAPNEDVVFDIDLYNSGPPLTYADFAGVDLRVTRQGAEIATLSVENGDAYAPTFTLRFPEPGGYDIDVRFVDANEKLIAAHTFHLEVPTGGTLMLQDGMEWLRYAVAGILLVLSLGTGGYALWGRFKR